MNNLKSTIAEAFLSLLGAFLGTMLNAIGILSSDSTKLAALKDNPGALLSYVPTHFDFLFIAFTLLVGAHYSIERGRGKLNQAFIVLFASLIVFLFYAYIAVGMGFSPEWKSGLPTAVGVGLIFFAIHAIALAKNEEKGAPRG